MRQDRIAELFRAHAAAAAQGEPTEQIEWALVMDFGRFAINPLGAVVASYVEGAAWADALRTLNEVRNGAAHGDAAKVAEAAGGAVTHLQVRRWHAALRELATAMDEIAANAVAEATGGPAPWEP